MKVLIELPLEHYELLCRCLARQLLREYIILKKLLFSSPENQPQSTYRVNSCAMKDEAHKLLCIAAWYATK
jgi:hypothetical protein